MTRRLLSFLFGGVAAAQASPTQKFYVTFPTFSNGCYADAIPVEGVSRTDALSRCGVTVWTEAEWREAQASAESRKKFRCVSATPLQQRRTQ